MSILSSLQRTFGSMAGSVNGSAYPIRQIVNSRIDPVELPPAALYALLKAFYLSNGVYDELARANVTLGRATASVKALRNVIPQVVDTFGAKLWPDPLTIVSENARLTDPIEKIWRWSNWRAKRRMVARWDALYGEAWIKVQADQARGRVWFEYLEPAYVTDFEEDPRGFVTFVRVDIPKYEENDDDARKLVTHTEVWSKDLGTYRRWQSDGDASGRSIKTLGVPEEEEMLATFGIDFVPFVRIVFKDIGEKRGIGAVQLAIEPVVDGDVSATNLHAMLYQDAEGVWVATAAGVDANGRPIPPIQVGAAASDGQNGRQSDGSIVVGKRSFWRLPGGYDLKSVVPDIDYDAALAILQDHDGHLERLMPALSYSRISELSGGDLSGRAIRFKLTPMVDQVDEVRATALERLAQADAMALTLGQVNGIDGFSEAGSFDAGDFEHTFEPQDIIPIGENEAAETENLQAQGYSTWRSAGLPDLEALQRAGYTKEEATKIVVLATQQAEEAMRRQQELETGNGDDKDADDA